jgi:aryl-alcohol dehydrogenase-like predicted oxidoreductase
MKYRHLGNSGLAVSRVCLGTMTFGQADWGCDGQTATQLVNAFVDAGGNFIDTADMYAGGVSEEILGSALQGHNRDDLVIATKCYFRQGENPNAKGLSRKHMIAALEASLRRMKLDYVDLYQLHGPDPHTPIEESMRVLEDMVRKGLVRYVGCSNFFGWQVIKANAAAASLGGETFCSGQYMYSLLRRDIEREVLPACHDQGMGLLCWSPLASGLLTGKYKDPAHPEAGSRIAHRAKIDVPRYAGQANKRRIDEVVSIAQELGKTPAQVSLSWLLHDRRVTSVIVGGTKQSQLEENIEAGDFDLTPEQYRRLSDVEPFDEGYPRDWVTSTRETTFNDIEFRWS